MVTENDIFKALGNGTVQLPPMVVNLVKRPSASRKLAGDPYSPDAVVELSWKRRRWKFLADFKAAATPRAFESALTDVLPAAKKAKLNPMVVLPYLAPESLSRLEEAGVSGLDLCGNGIVNIPGELLIVRTGQPNRFPRSEPIRNVYRGDSSLIARAFLIKPIYSAVGEILTTINKNGGNISFATVSKVLKTLEADLIVSRSKEGIKLLQASKLLDQLAANYRPPKVVERYVGKVQIADGELSKRLAEGARQIGSRLEITGAASAANYSVLAREPVAAAYCSASPRDVLSALKVKFEETDRFPNVDLICTEDGPTYFEPVEKAGVQYASPVQAYLELMSGDKRQRETAEQVREFIVSRVRDYREKP
jgi:hypothetical protein